MKLLSSPTSSAPRLERRRIVDRAWEHYVVDGIQPVELSEEIQRSWARAREQYQIDPHLEHPRRLLRPDELTERRERDPVLRLAAAILDDFAARLDLSGHVLAYLDGEGWMLSIDGDRRVVDRVAEIEFRPGANWAEDSAATNGPGTALAEGKAIEVFASEHFVSTWQAWSCAAAPIFEPGGDKPVGLVDITGPWQVQRRQAILVARAIARAVQERLRAANGVRDEVVRHALLALKSTGDALVGVDAHGRVIGANDAAAKRRIVTPGGLPPAVKKAIAEILRDSTRGGDVSIQGPDGKTIVASPVQYDGANVGAILRATAARPTHASSARTQAQPSTRYEFSRILGRSAPIHRAVELAKTAARNTLPVVLYGESGTGKELFAQAIHSASDRRGARFVAVNCGSIPAQLVEAELFGYESGTFTGARRDGNPGRFEDADGGTLFLDEVSELPLQAQTALLRVLQEREVVRLGGSTPRSVDVRVIAATNKPLEEEIRAKRFRRDLFYRLNVFFISVPALRERGDEDLALLADVFVKEAEAEVQRSDLTLAPAALAALRSHSWPGNVRELKNVLLRAAAIAPETCIGPEDLVLDAGAPLLSAARSAPVGGGAQPRGVPPEAERDALVAILDACAWNVARAAERLGVSRMTLYRRLHRHGISRNGTPPPAAAEDDGASAFGSPPLAGGLPRRS
jgi:transcriptional regulator of acetoin/glycerol metabolism